MSNFNRYCMKAKHAAEGFAKKVDNAFETTKESVKKKALEMQIDEQYEKLGEIVYRDLHTEESLEEEKLEVIAKIDALFDKLSLLHQEEANKEENEETEESLEESSEETTEENQ